MLRHYVSPQMNDWDKHFGMVQFAIDNAWQEAVQEADFAVASFWETVILHVGGHTKPALLVGVPCGFNAYAFIVHAFTLLLLAGCAKLEKAR